MAGLDYIELEGNGPLLVAARTLLSLSAWKEKPHLMRRGHVEYSEIVARHLIRLYVSLEGLSKAERHRLFSQVHPDADLRTREHFDRAFADLLSDLAA